MLRCARLHNTKNPENSNGGALCLVKLQTKGCHFTKGSTPLWVFFTFLKLYKWYQILQIHIFIWLFKFFIFIRSRRKIWSLSDLNFRFCTCFSKEFLDIQATIECGFTLKHVRDMTRTYSQMHRTDKYSQHSSIICPVWLNGWVFVYELSGCGFESCCSHISLLVCALMDLLSWISSLVCYCVCKIFQKNISIQKRFSKKDKCMGLYQGEKVLFFESGRTKSVIPITSIVRGMKKLKCTKVNGEVLCLLASFLADIQQIVVFKWKKDNGRHLKD